jgi:hypothetical protein
MSNPATRRGFFLRCHGGSRHSRDMTTDGAAIVVVCIVSLPAPWEKPTAKLFLLAESKPWR